MRIVLFELSPRMSDVRHLASRNTWDGVANTLAYISIILFQYVYFTFNYFIIFITMVNFF